MTEYSCSNCGSSVQVVPTSDPSEPMEIIRDCECNAPIFADMKAHAVGVGGMLEGDTAA